MIRCLCICSVSAGGQSVVGSQATGRRPSVLAAGGASHSVRFADDQRSHGASIWSGRAAGCHNTRQHRCHIAAVRVIQRLCPWRWCRCWQLASFCLTAERQPRPRSTRPVTAADPVSADGGAVTHGLHRMGYSERSHNSERNSSGGGSRLGLYSRGDVAISPGRSLSQRPQQQQQQQQIEPTDVRIWFPHQVSLTWLCLFLS